jgi:hypothetical protein
MDKFGNIPNGNHKVLCLFKEKVLHGTIVAYHQKMRIMTLKKRYLLGNSKTWNWGSE